MNEVEKDDVLLTLETAYRNMNKNYEPYVAIQNDVHATVKSCTK